MAVETSIARNVSATNTTTALKKAARKVRVVQPASAAVKTKAAGEGAVVAENPMARFMLPSFADENEFLERLKIKPFGPSGVTVNLPARGTNNGSRAVEIAKTFIGTPYKWGGTTPLGFDCSGFTQYVYKQLGIELPRISWQQAQSGKRITLDQLKPGDLVAWDNSSRNNGADHVAIYIGNGQIIEAPKPGASVRIRALSDKGRAWGVAMNL